MRDLRIQSSESGFTLLELLVVIGIIGILAVIAFPAYQTYRDRAKAVTVVSELKNFSSAFYAYYVDNETFPADNHEAIPPGMENILPSQFEETTAIGGRYNWEGPDNYPYAGISISGSVDASLAQLVDNLLDDGSLSSGSFRTMGNGRPTFVLEE